MAIAPAIAENIAQKYEKSCLAESEFTVD